MTRQDEWKKKFSQQRRSGLSISAWCKQEGIRTNQFYYWHKRMGKEGESAEDGKFVRIDQAEAVELLVGENLRLRIPANFDVMSLKRLLEVLEC